MKKVVSVGAVNVDVMKYVDRFCESDEEVAIKEMLITSGGQAGNIAAGFGLLGHKSYFFGNIGNDSYTDMLKKDFRKSNVDHSYAIPTDSPNNTIHCIVDSKGERQMYAFSSADFSSHHFPERLYDADMIIFASIIKNDAIEIYTDIARKAKKNNTQIALVPSSLFTKLGLEKLKPLLKYTDYLLASKREIEELVESINNFQQLTDIVPNIVMTNGKEGAMMFRENKIMKVKAKKINKVIDTTGAGDTFAAAFLSSVLNGNNHREALDFANNVAAVSITKKGARAMPTIDELERINL